jgi:threonine dehydrogenase-like Zn-dependent dehydrogenase
MKQVAITGVRQAALIDVSDPQPKDNWVLVKVHAAPMCTEVKGFIDGSGGHGYGHEAAGEVVEVAQPGCVRVGDRVVVQPGTPCGICDLCRAGDYIHCQRWVNFTEFAGGNSGLATMAQYLLKADWLLSPIPDDVSYEHASLAVCGLGPSFSAFQQMAVGAFDTVLITGLGPVGLGGIVNAHFRGARVIGIDGNPYRAEVARQMGATVLDPADPECLQQILNLTGGAGVDRALDCSGIVSAHRLCIDATRRRGQIAFVGQCHQETPLTISTDMIQKGLTLHGVWHYNLADYPKVMRVIHDSPLLNMLISHVLPMSRIQQAWELQASGQCAKIILQPWE